MASGGGVVATILVTGGTGLLGRELVPRLVDEGHRVRVLTRSGPVPPEVDLITGDLTPGSALTAAIAGVEVIVHAATDPRRSADVDVAGTQALLQEAGRAGVAHVIYPSIVGAERSTMGYYRAKVAAERAIETGEVPWTITRFTHLHDSLAGLLDSASRFPVMPVPSGFRLQPLETRVAARRIVELAARPAAGRVAEIGGPEEWESRALARAYLTAARKRRLTVRLPVRSGIAFPYRAGHHLAAVQAENTRTWQMYLRQRFGGAPRGR